jgi:antibiotic biosynthesis monooxygenase (ABM) superfamily enzyme
MRRFAPLDTAEAAREVLKKIRQGKQSVAEYMAQFDQYTGQTGWSDADHRQQFYDRLAEVVKDGLALTD